MSNDMWNDVSKDKVDALIRLQNTESGDSAKFDALVEEIGRLQSEIERLCAERDVLKTRIEMANEALEEIRDEARQAQGEWSPVDELYAPEWCASYKVIFDIARVTLKPNNSGEDTP